MSLSEKVYSHTKRYPPRRVFDLEGTLVDLEGFHLDAFHLAALQFGVQFGAKDFKNFVGAGDAAISAYIAKQRGEERLQEEIRQCKKALYDEMLHASPISPREGVVAYLEQAKAEYPHLVVASITPDESAKNILRRSSLDNFFSPEYILTESSVRRRKPDPEVYRKAAALLHVNPRRLIVHEDSPTGVAAGVRAQSHVAAFPVHEGLVFDPQPDANFPTWVGVTPEEVLERLRVQESPRRRRSSVSR